MSSLNDPKNANVLKKIKDSLSNGCEVRKVNNEWVGYYYLIDKDSIEVKMPLCWVNDEKMMVIVCDLNHGVLNYVFSELTQASLVDSKRISHLLYNFIYILMTMVFPYFLKLSVSTNWMLRNGSEIISMII